MPASKKNKPLTADDVKNLIGVVLAEKTQAINDSAATLSPVNGVAPTSASDIRGMQLDDYLALRSRDITIEDAKVRAQFGSNILGSIRLEHQAEIDPAI